MDESVTMEDVTQVIALAVCYHIGMNARWGLVVSDVRKGEEQVMMQAWTRCAPEVHEAIREQVKKSGWTPSRTNTMLNMRSLTKLQQQKRREELIQITMRVMTSLRVVDPAP